ncbi:MAG: hypothetical protein KDK99_07205, partial [Verrucomicrobiales bacterium]|nr:hypothetical protein [Verrucomicrobiales bacterium]
MVLTTAMAVMIGSSSRADVLTWDADAGTAGNQDGAGTWMVAQPNWFNGTTSTANQNWVDGSDAIFGVGSGAAGAVTLGGPITVGALTFDPTGSGAYTLSGDVLTLTGGVTMNAAATIQSVLAGSAGLNLSGSQMLTLSGGSANTYTGTTTIDGGATLMLSRTAGVTAVTGDISITNGGRLRMSAADQIDDGATVTMSGATSVFNGSAPNSGPSNQAETF